MVDLHTHTTESDGTCSPQELVALAREVGLQALAITDHDTFSGYDLVRGCQDLEVLCGIELSTRFHGHSVHLLGYFLTADPGEEFRAWVRAGHVTRHRRNEQLVEKLQACGFAITLDEVRQRSKQVPGRPHFAAVLRSKGYVASVDEAFAKYLGESGACYVPREEPGLAEVIARVRAAGGLAVLAHPKRVASDYELLAGHVREMHAMGLQGLEVHYSDHSAEDTAFLLGLAEELGMLCSGGSDFHGDAKPHIALGCVGVPRSVLEGLRILLAR